MCFLDTKSNLQLSGTITIIKISDEILILAKPEISEATYVPTPLFWIKLDPSIIIFFLITNLLIHINFE
jgi:hypothetical protein